MSRRWRKHPGCVVDNDRGVALIITLFVVALVTILVLEYYFDATVEMELADNQAHDMQAYHLAMAGLNFAKTILQKDDAAYDTADDLWSTLAIFGCVTPQQLLTLSRDFTKDSVAPTDQDDQAASEATDTLQPCVSLSVVDEARKLPINGLVNRNTDAIDPDWQQIFERFFEELGIDIDATDPVDALIDWIDVSPGHLEGGAEDDYYESLPNPYKTPDRPMEVPGELRLVRHFGCDMLAKLFPGKECKDVPALDLGSNAYLTPYSGGPGVAKVNLNTASEAVLRALTRGDTVCVEDVLEKRLALEGQVVSEPITNVGSLTNCSNVPNFAKVAGVKSDYFRIESTGVLGMIRKKVIAVLRRDQQGSTVVYFKVE